MYLNMYIWNYTLVAIKLLLSTFHFKCNIELLYMLKLKLLYNQVLVF